MSLSDGLVYYIPSKNQNNLSKLRLSGRYSFAIWLLEIKYFSLQKLVQWLEEKAISRFMIWEIEWVTWEFQVQLMAKKNS